MKSRSIYITLALIISVHTYAEEKEVTPASKSKKNRELEQIKAVSIDSNDRKSHTIPDTKKLNGSYAECNAWLQDYYPGDKMMVISMDGDLVETEKGLLNYSNKSEDGKILKTTTVKVKKKNRYLNETIDYDVQKMDSGLILINRTHTDEQLYKTNLQNGWGNQNQFGYNSQQLQVQPPMNQGYPGNNGNISNANIGGMNSPINKHSVTTRTSITMKKGKNGKCFVSKIRQVFGQHQGITHTTDTKKCNEILNFHKKYPKIANCTKSGIFKELNSILGELTPFINTNPYNNGNVFGKNNISISDQINTGLSLPFRLINKSIEEAKNCDKNKLTAFVNDNALFSGPGFKQGPRPAGKKVKQEK